MRKILWIAVAMTAWPIAAQAHEFPVSSFVRAQAVDLLDGILTPEQTTTLNLLAHQTAVSDVCAGFVVDEVKFTKEFETLRPVEADKMTDEEKAYHDKHLLVAYGILVGGELAAIGQKQDEACAEAEESRADADFLKQMVWKAQ